MGIIIPYLSVLLVLFSVYTKTCVMLLDKSRLVLRCPLPRSTKIESCPSLFLTSRKLRSRSSCLRLLACGLLSSLSVVSSKAWWCVLPLFPLSSATFSASICVSLTFLCVLKTGCRIPFINWPFKTEFKGMKPIFHIHLENDCLYYLDNPKCLEFQNGGNFVFD